ncbi:MAG TPA: DUF4956 domain-containing protein [Saprospiraceae bacterium]|nr:DUF4956 domain-containing protein [Saprospiraceae bacterium]
MDILSSISNQDGPSFILIVFSVLLAFLLSSLLVFTYEKTSRDIVPPDHFIQSLILMAIVTATIMESIGDSMARGFGIFGALAILRFRTNIFNPRNVAFIFAAMAVGIACGVNSFANAIIGTVAFCLIAFFLRMTPYGRKNNLLGQLRFEMNGDVVEFEKAQQIIRKHCRNFVLKRYRINYLPQKENLVEYAFDLRLQNEMHGMQLTENLRTIESLQNIRLSFNDTYVHQTD